MEAPRLLSPAEIEELDECETDTDRDAFLGRFWLAQEDREKGLRTIYEKRMAYADAEFGTKTVSGWRTDRGRVWVLYGPPDIRMIRTPLSDGRGFIATYPFETWLYRDWPVDGEQWLDFVDPTMTNDYRLIRPWDELSKAFGRYSRLALEGLESVPVERRDRLRDGMNTHISSLLSREWRSWLARQTTAAEDRMAAFEPIAIVEASTDQWLIVGCATMEQAPRPTSEPWTMAAVWDGGDWRFFEPVPAVQAEGADSVSCSGGG